MNQTLTANVDVKEICERVSDSPLFLGVCLLALLSEALGLSQKTQANGILHFILKFLTVLARVAREANNEPNEPPASQPASQPASRKASADMTGSARASGTVPADEKD